MNNQSLTEKTLSELEIDDGELLSMRQRLTAEKQALQGQLAALNARCETHLPQKEYQKLQSQRGSIVKMLSARPERNKSYDNHRPN